MQNQILQDTMCANFQAKRTTLTFLAQIFPKMDFCSRNIKNLSPESESVSPRHYVCQFSGKTDNFNFFSPNLPKKEFRGRKFKILSLESESAPPRYHVCQFSGKTDNFEIFSLNLGKLPNYVRYFRSYNVDGVPESCVWPEMSWVEVDGAGWRLK